MAAPRYGDERAVVEAHLRRLDAGECAAFVADLWAERGYDTTRDGVLVTATRDTESLTIQVGGLRQHAADPDVVVALDGDPSVADGVRVLDATDLTERLWYAVDRSVARALCERHLGAPPSALRPPLGMRIRRRLAALPRPAVTATVLLAVLAVVGGAVVVGLPGGGDTALPGMDSPATPLSDASADSLTEQRYPPGLSRAGIRDVDALAEAHRRAVANRPLSIWVDRDRPTYEDGEWTLTTLDYYVRSDGERYVVEISEGSRDYRAQLGMLYHDGTASYLEVLVGEHASYRAITPREQDRLMVPTPTPLALGLVDKYLSTPSTEVTGTVERQGRTLYRLVGTGQPDSQSLGDVENYTVTAAVGTDGLVYDLTATYTVVEGEQRFTVTREVTYGRLDSTTVPTPDWYERRFADGPTPEA